MNYLKPFCAALLATALNCFFLSGPAFGQMFKEDLTIRMTAASGNGSSLVTRYYSGNSFRQISSDGTDFIVQYDKKKMIVLDNKKQTYIEIDFSKGNKGINVGNNLRQPAGGGDGQQTRVTPMGPGERIAGYDTNKFLIEAGGASFIAHIAPNLLVPKKHSKATHDTYGPLAGIADVEEMLGVSQFVSGSTMKVTRTLTMANRTVTWTAAVDLVDLSAIPRSTFEVPSGYKLIPLKF